jgi:flagellar basal-body rod modification protein FlgD
MTQLQNQDPTSPMDTNAFTTELAQFTGVEQQIATNTNLTQLIQLTQASDVLGSSSVLGKQVQVTSSQMPLQNGTGEVTFTAPSAGPVDISVYNAAGAKVEEQLVQATSGSNTWNWDGTGTTGAQEPDGAYTVVVTAENADGSTTPLSFTVGGTVTGVEQNSSQLDLDLGALQTSFGNVQSVGN